MLKAIGAIVTSASNVIIGVTDAIQPLTNSLNYATKSVELHAQELYKDTEFECHKSDMVRADTIKKFEAELAALSETE